MGTELNDALFETTSHSPSLASLVGYEKAAELVDFCFIANPYYPTEAMIQKMVDHFPMLIKTYPNSNQRTNLINLAKVIGVDPDQLLLGNGATELITDLCDHFVESIGVPIPTFGEYIEKVLPAKVYLYQLDSRKDYQLDLMDYLQWLRENQIKAALIINPANPTGQLFSLSEMHRFLSEASFLDLVIVDESFIDFSQEQVPSLLHSTHGYQNLIIVRSMSKHCGVPGLRLGYAHTANTALLRRMKNALPTWNVNTIAEYYLSLLPDTDVEYQHSRLRIIEDIRAMYNDLQAMPGLQPYKTGANFILVRLHNGMSAKEMQTLLLQEYGMYVRDCSNKQGMDHYHIRIATQGREKDVLLMDALREILAQDVTRKPRRNASKAPRILMPTAHEVRKNLPIQYVGNAHLDMVLEYGAIPIVIPALEKNLNYLDEFLLEGDGLLLMEGEDLRPEMYKHSPEELHLIHKTNEIRDRIEDYLIRKALALDMPILAICRGCQLLNVALGGTLYADVEQTRETKITHRDFNLYHEYRHGLRFVPGSYLQKLYDGASEIKVNSYHHQGIKDVASSLEVMAYAEDGLIEAVRKTEGRFAVGLQFHPERAVGEYEGHRRIFEAFIRAAREYNGMG